MIAVDKRRSLNRMISRAIVVIWRNPDNDWNYFRLERVQGNRIALTGMSDDDGNHHVGDFFWANLDEIKSIKLRD